MFSREEGCVHKVASQPRAGDRQAVQNIICYLINDEYVIGLNCNKQLQVVCQNSSPPNLQLQMILIQTPSFKPSPHPKMPDIHVSTNDIEKLIKGLNLHKAAGPDQLKPIVLQPFHKELALILKLN